MMRRSVLTFSAGLVRIIAGCVGVPSSGDDADESGEATVTSDGEEPTESTETVEQEPDTEDTGPDIRTSFEVHDLDTGILEEAASVTFTDQTVTVSGAIIGSNTCYTARLETANIRGGTLQVGVESYEDVDENDGCYDAIVGIEYVATIEILADTPAAVRIEHNGELVTTESVS